MSAVNPYAPPQAVVADVRESHQSEQPVRTWSRAGRIGRLRYVAHNTAAYLVIFVGAGILSALLGAIGLAMLSVVVMGVAGIAYFLFMIIKTVQRSHDMGWSGWTALLALIPLVGLVWLFYPGSKDDNDYGAPPPPNGIGVWLVAVIIPLVITLILLAVALPAYNSYVKLAQQAQQSR